MQHYIKLIIKHRFLVLGLLLILTILSGGILSNVKISGSMPDLFLGKSPKYLSYQERVKEFGSDALIVIAFEEKNLLSRSSIEKLKRVEEKVKNLPKIKDMKSILDLQDVRIVDGMPRAEHYVDMALRQPEHSGAILDIIRNEPLFSGLWISKDGMHSAVVIELDDDKIQTDMEVPSILEEIINIFEEGGFDPTNLHKGGQVPLVVEWLFQTEFNIRTLFPIVCLVLLLTVFILFQRFWPVFITFIVTLIGVSWTMALAVLLFGQINMMTAIVPGIIMIIAFSDVVHLCSSYHMELSKGERKEQAIEKSCSEVGAACLFTSITTFFGFISLALAPSPVSRQLGVVLGVGVGISLIIAVTLTPVIFSLMKVPKPLRVGGASKPQLLLYRFTDFLVHVTRKRPWVIVTIFCLLLAFTAMGIARIEFETDVTKRMAEDNQIRIDSQYFADHFGGTTYIDIFLETSGSLEILKPEIISRIGAFQNSLLNIPEVDNVMSILGYFNYMQRIFNPGIEQAKLPPLTEKDIANYVIMLKMSGSDLLRGMIDKENKTIRMRLGINTSGYFATHRISQEAMKAGRAILGNEVDIEVTGIWALLGEWITKFMKGQRRGLNILKKSFLCLLLHSFSNFKLLNPLFQFFISRFYGHFKNSQLVQ